ncbi:hypothetical protein ABG067_009582, partial [Albugo candida]
VLQPGPAAVGYSQSRSTPAVPYLAMKSVFHLIKLARDDAEATMGLNLVEPVHPPTLTMTLVPAALANFMRV